jgi:hypothetical protein
MLLPLVAPVAIGVYLYGNIDMAFSGFPIGTPFALHGVLASTAAWDTKSH